MRSHYEVVVVGGGPGGYVAAIRASQLGKKVLLIERAEVGGTCLHWGCIPTKALLHCAEVYHSVSNAHLLGIEAKIEHLDFARILAYSRGVVSKMTAGLRGLLASSGVEVMYGDARVVDSSLFTENIVLDSKVGDNPAVHLLVKKVERGEEGSDVCESASDSQLYNDCKVNNSDVFLSASHLILAAGAKSRVLPIFEDSCVERSDVWTYREALMQSAVPESLLVVGSGAIGIEFASFYNTFGTKVHVIEMQSQILQSEDIEIADIAERAFIKCGIAISKRTVIDSISRIDSADSVESCANKYKVILKNLDSGELSTIVVGKILSAIGVMPNIDNLGLEVHKNVQLSDKGFILVDDRMRTGDQRIYAIGDIVAPPYLAHKASHEGLLAAEAIAGLSTHPLDSRKIPGCIYASPQVSSVGYTEAAATAAGFEYSVGRFPFAANGKAVASGDDVGMVKVLIDKRYGECLGVHMVGHGVSELIGAAVLGLNAEATADTWLQSVFPHPTLSEVLPEAVRVALGLNLHVPK